MGRLHLGRIKWLKVTQESGADQGLHTSFLMSRPVVLGQKASEVNLGGFLNHTKSYPVKSLNGLDCQLSGLGLEGTPHSHWSAAVNYQMTLQRWWACINIWLLYLLWNILTIEWKKTPSYTSLHCCCLKTALPTSIPSVYVRWCNLSRMLNLPKEKWIWLTRPQGFSLFLFHVPDV